MKFLCLSLFVVLLLVSYSEAQLHDEDIHMNQELLSNKNSGIKTKPFTKGGVEFTTRADTAEIEDLKNVDENMFISIATTEKPGLWKRIFG
ncbi:unnamed protein product [Chironomus riparius]|uniref:Uncharacterized protein n=1 Tax=Chironomus riparius TaxID=315576 RepID=A0A9N9S799_9DIPT|nr:unnamed protein product [Chironomus riparius]